MTTKPPQIQEFGRLVSGEPVVAVTLQDLTGLVATVMSYGASIQSVRTPDRHQQMAEVTFGHPELESYLRHPQFAGATVGRVANRIANGRFSLDGRSYQIPPNDGTHALHGGALGFDKANWQIEGLGAQSVTMRHTSPHGDQGFPGTLTVRATYALDGAGRLSVEYVATTDAPTIVSISNHSYWNLTGDKLPRDAMQHRLALFAEQYLPVDPELIPTGERQAVAGTAFDFRSPTTIGAMLRNAADPQIRRGRGYDHNWVISATPADHTRVVAQLDDPVSGRCLTIDTTQPGIQFYSGNFFNGTTVGHGAQLARMGDFVALEPQALPDTANRPGFGTIRLDSGETYRNIIGWKFTTEKD